jgi:hypothetical protein
MDRCGLCVVCPPQNEVVPPFTQCTQCKIDMCGNCAININADIFVINVCGLCFNVSSVRRMCDYYCICCDSCVPYEEFSQTSGKCKKCAKQNKTVDDRALLPHHSAKPSIEKQFIPVIAQIIFCYYHAPRRYFRGEF